MKKIIYLLLALYFLLVLSACGSNPSEKTSPEEKPNSGKSIFEENCAACHGPDGKLGTLGAKDLSISTLDKTQRMEIITNGKGTMTPFGSMLDKKEIEAVADYIQTLRK